MPPVFYLPGIPAQQHIGHFHAPPFSGPGVHGRSEQIVLEGIEKRGGLIVQYARDQPAKGIDQHRRGQFAPAQHVIADGDLPRHIGLPDPFIDALVMPADQEHVLLHRELVGDRLVQCLTVRGEVDDLVKGIVPAQFPDGCGQRLRHHDHARASAELVIIHLTVFIDGPFAKVMHVNLKQPLVFGPLEYGVVERAVQQFRQDGKNMYMHMPD